MKGQFFLSALVAFVLFSCGNMEEKGEPAVNSDTTVSESSADENLKLPDMPPYVVYKNWEIGDPHKLEIILGVYDAWDHKDPGKMASLFADSATLDLPGGNHQATTSETAELIFRQWRRKFAETSNIPFSIVSLHNKDLDQDWVVAWVWNKWKDTNGKKDSMLYCDNWRISGDKIVYVNSLENSITPSLSEKLNQIVPK